MSGIDIDITFLYYSRSSAVLVMSFAEMHCDFLGVKTYIIDHSVLARCIKSLESTCNQFRKITILVRFFRNEKCTINSRGHTTNKALDATLQLPRSF